MNKDQDHLNAIILNHATLPDRTNAIMTGNSQLLLEKLKQDFDLLDGAHVQQTIILCNTMHYFYNQFEKFSKVPIYHLIKETATYVSQNGVSNIGILATNGTIFSEIYQNELSKLGIKFYVPDESIQNHLMRLIYEDVKIGNHHIREKFDVIVQHLKEKGAKHFILGCTELSILKDDLQLGDEFIDPLEIAAKQLIIQFNRVLKEES